MYYNVQKGLRKRFLFILVFLGLPLCAIMVLVSNQSTVNFHLEKAGEKKENREWYNIL